MQEIRKEKNIFLGNKRREERMDRKSFEINEKIENPEKKILRDISLIKPVLNKINVIDKNKIELDEKKEENDSSIQLNENKNINFISPKVKEKNKKACEKCGKRNNVLIFNSCQGILEYLASLNFKNLLFNNPNTFEKYKKIKYNQPKKICSNCLFKISNNHLELENFIRNNENNNEYPFNDLFDNMNLKYFNNIEKPQKKPILNNLNKKIINQKQLINPDINNLKNNSLNFISNPNLIWRYINPLSNQFIPYLLNYPNFSRINQPVGIIPLNIGKENNINNSDNNNDDSNDYVKIKNKDFDELFNLISECYHKLLTIKNNRDLNLNDSCQKQNNSNFNSSDATIKETFTNNINNNNFNEQLWNKSNKNINSNILENFKINGEKK